MINEINTKGNDALGYGNSLLSPIKLKTEVLKLCDEIDKFYDSYPKNYKNKKASDLIKGVYYAMRPECKSNPDWMSQAANSAREVLYPFWGGGNESSSLIGIIKKYAINHPEVKIETFEQLDKIYKKLSDITHHGVDIRGFSNDEEYSKFSDEDFQNLIYEFVNILYEVLTVQQLNIHKIIDLFISKNNKNESKAKDLTEILKTNHDAVNYFFAKADEKWIDWLWGNGFLDVIKTASDNKSGYGYNTPQINYLAKVAKQKPENVIKIMLDDKVATSADNFRPELVSQFLSICAELPVDLLIRIIPKIKEQNWVKSISRFSIYSFQYKKMFNELLDAKKVEDFLQLAEVVLSVREKENIDARNSFSFADLSQTQVFEFLIKLNNVHKEKAFGLVIKALSEEASFTNEFEKNIGIFKCKETFYLSSVDFFELKWEKGRNFIERGDDVKELLATIVEIARQLFVIDTQNANYLFKKYIGSFDDKNDLLDTGVMWRLRLFVLSLSPEVMKDEIKKHLWRLFHSMNKSYINIIEGTEYKKLLQVSFEFFDKKDREEYVKNIIRAFCEKSKKETDKKRKKFHLKQGSEILSMIQNELEVQERIEIINKKGFKLNKAYKPSKKMSGVVCDMILPKGPISEEEFNKLSIEDIAQRLNNEWTKEKLSKINEGKGDFFNPVDINGMGKLLSGDVKKRLREYIENANLFNYGKIDIHYIYYFLRGVLEAIKKDEKVSDWSKLIDLLMNLVNEGSNVDEKRVTEFYDVWIFGWREIYRTIADILQELLEEKNGKAVINLDECRYDILHIISQLLKNEDPVIEDEELGNAKIITTDKDSGRSIVSNPYSIAINSVRGGAFECLMFFIKQDKKGLEDKDIKIKNDVKEIYESVLKNEKTRAIMFLFGHYFWSFYFRDKNWILGLFDDIFPKEDDEKYYLYIASLEGYLTQAWYKKIFIEEKIQKLYLQVIELEDVEYPHQENLRNPHEALAGHLALAFVYLEHFDFENELFKMFWEKANIVSQKKFISFIGGTLSRNNIGEIIKTQKIDINKIKKLWSWALDNVSEVEIFVGFGSWLDTDENIFDDKYLVKMMSKTLSKTDGVIELDYVLKKKLKSFAEVDAGATFSIIEYYLLDKNDEINEHRKKDFFSENSVKNIKLVLEVIYKNKNMQNDIKKLIDILVEKGGEKFWILKEVIR